MAASENTDDDDAMAFLPQCGKIDNFLPIRFYVKSILVNFLVHNFAHLRILECPKLDLGDFEYLPNFHRSKML